MNRIYKNFLVLCLAAALLCCAVPARAALQHDGEQVHLPAAVAVSAEEPKSPVVLFAGIVLAPAGIAALVCLGAASGMRNVRHGSSVSGYVAPEGLQLDKKTDRFSHRTETRTRIEKKDTPARG